MKKLCYVFVLLLISCESHIDFKIKNNSETDFDSVVVHGLGRLKIESLNKGSEVSGYIDYSKSEERSDGGYGIELFKKGLVKRQNFGYYTNGSPTESGFNITIEKDTILIQSVRDKY